MTYTSAHGKFLFSETTPSERARWLKLHEVDKLTIIQLAKRMGVTKEMARRVCQAARAERERAA